MRATDCEVVTLVGPVTCCARIFCSSNSLAHGLMPDIQCELNSESCLDKFAKSDFFIHTGKSSFCYQ